MFDQYDAPMERSGHEVERAVADLFAVQDITLGVPEHQKAIRLRGYLQVPSEKAYPRIAERLREIDYTAILRHDPETGLDELVAVPGALPKVERSRLWVHGALLLATIFTTLYVGAGMSEARPPDDLWWPLFNFWRGWPFSLSLMSILLAHELGHYFVSRLHGVPASLPYFVPLPIPDFLGNVLGTLGAVIRMKAPIGDRRAMLDIGAAGPLIGLVVALPVLIIGLSLSQVEPLPADQIYSMEGNSLLYLLLKYLMFGQWLPGAGVDVFIHPVAFAGWAGLLVTSLNLIPAGQLDGGHVLYSILGERAQQLTWPIIIILAALGLLAWPGWFIWAGLVYLFGRGHPGPLDRVTRLDARRKLIAGLVLAAFVLTFTPVPLTIVVPEGMEATGGLARLGLPALAGTLVVLNQIRRRIGVTAKRD
jgi:membrane-associated protease RseP (regulator of RpoE activity)